MGLFSKQFSNVVEWNESDPEVLLWKWDNPEIKKGSKLIIRMGQDAVFMYNGRIEGIFSEEGQFDIESDIIPFLTTLKSFQFGFNTPMRAEVLFINTKEVQVKWGTKNVINIPTPGLPGGMPIRAFGTFSCKVEEADVLIEKVAGVKKNYTVEDVKERIVASLDQLLMSGIAKAGRDMFNLQADAATIAKGIQNDLDMEMRKYGIAIADFKIENFSYPQEIAKMQEKAAAQSMVGDMNRYSQMAVANGMEKGGGNGANLASDMVQVQMGMAMGQQMMNQNTQAGQNAQMNQSSQNGQPAGYPKFCPGCGTPTTGAKFCPNCGTKLG